MLVPMKYLAQTPGQETNSSTMLLKSCGCPDEDPERSNPEGRRRRRLVESIQKLGCVLPTVGKDIERAEGKDASTSYNPYFFPVAFPETFSDVSGTSNGTNHGIEIEAKPSSVAGSESKPRSASPSTTPSLRSQKRVGSSPNKKSTASAMPFRSTRPPTSPRSNRKLQQQQKGEADKWLPFDTQQYTYSFDSSTTSTEGAAAPAEHQSSRSREVNKNKVNKIVDLSHIPDPPIAVLDDHSESDARAPLDPSRGGGGRVPTMIQFAIGEAPHLRPASSLPSEEPEQAEVGIVPTTTGTPQKITDNPNTSSLAAAPTLVSHNGNSNNNFLFEFEEPLKHRGFERNDSMDDDVGGAKLQFTNVSPKKTLAAHLSLAGDGVGGGLHEPVPIRKGQRYRTHRSNGSGTTRSGATVATWQSTSSSNGSRASNVTGTTTRSTTTRVQDLIHRFGRHDLDTTVTSTLLEHSSYNWRTSHHPALDTSFGSTNSVGLVDTSLDTYCYSEDEDDNDPTNPNELWREILPR